MAGTSLCHDAIAVAHAQPLELTRLISGQALRARLRPIQFGQGSKHGFGLRSCHGARPDTRSTDDPSLVEEIGGRHWQHPKGEAMGSGEIKAAPQKTPL